MAPRVVYNDGKTRRLIHENGEQEDELIEAVAGDIEPLASSCPLVAAFSRYAGELIEACEARKQEAEAESDAVLTHTELRKLFREVAKLSDGPGLHAAPVEPLLQLVGFARAHVAEGARADPVRAGEAVLAEDGDDALDEWARAGAAPELVSTGAAIDASVFALAVMCAPRVDRRLVAEESIELCSTPSRTS